MRDCESDTKGKDPDGFEGIKCEYLTLRDEILMRIKLRQRIATTTLTFSGVLMGFGLKSPLVALLYPPLAAFLAFLWAQNDHRVRQIATYIHDRIESNYPGLNWETYLRNVRVSTEGLSSWRYVVLAYGGILLFTQLFALCLGLFWTPDKSSEMIRGNGFVRNVLCMIDFLAIGIVLWILKKASQRPPAKPEACL